MAPKLGSTGALKIRFPFVWCGGSVARGGGADLATASRSDSSRSRARGICIALVLPLPHRYRSASAPLIWNHTFTPITFLLMLGIAVPLRDHLDVVGMLRFMTDINQPSLPHSFFYFLFCSCVYFSLYGPFNCISFRKFSQQLFTFHSVLLVFSLLYWSFQLYISL